MKLVAQFPLWQIYTHRKDISCRLDSINTAFSSVLYFSWTATSDSSRTFVDVFVTRWTQRSVLTLPASTSLILWLASLLSFPHDVPTGLNLYTTRSSTDCNSTERDRDPPKCVSRVKSNIQAMSTSDDQPVVVSATAVLHWLLSTYSRLVECVNLFSDSICLKAKIN